MKIKYKTFKFYPKNAKEGVAIVLNLHWDKDVQEYVLCDKRLFRWTHYCLEDVQEMLNILKEENGKQ